jgi:hypothetical protein
MNPTVHYFTAGGALCGSSNPLRLTFADLKAISRALREAALRDDLVEPATRGSRGAPAVADSVTCSSCAAILSVRELDKLRAPYARQWCSRAAAQDWATSS